ncbi:MAG: VOC family protein [Nitrosopumilus sp.]
MFYTIEVNDADQELARMQKIGAKIELDIRDEPWGERHFAIKDLNGIALNISQPIRPTGEYAQ